MRFHQRRDLLRGLIRADFDIGNLCPRMDTGVGSARAVDFHRMACHAAENLFNFSLNGIVRISLPLPAAVPPAIVFYDQSKIRHVGFSFAFFLV